LLSAAAEDLAYLRLPNDKKPPSHIEGRLATWVYGPTRQSQGHAAGVPGVRVVVEGGGRKIETKTDADGRYKVDVMGGRSYRVEFGAVDGFLVRGSGQEVMLPHYLSCGVADAGLGIEGQISGQVVDERGFPIPFFPVALESTPRYLRQHAVTDTAGRFQFPVRYPGPYYVTPSEELWTTPPALPPLNTAPIVVPVSTHVDAGTLRVPASVPVTIVELLIEDSAGKPAAGADVQFKQPDIFNAISYEAMPKADQRGRFQISLVAGQRYEIIASSDQNSPPGALDERAYVIIEAGPKPIRIRLAPFR
jgi:hypothetical protein